MQQIKRILVLLFVLFSVVGCDQATKSVAQSQLSSAPPILYFNGLVRLEYVENPGAFLSLGANLSDTAQHWIFTIAAALILSGLLLFILRELQKIHALVLLAFALFLGGGAGNLIDRVTNDGRVIDFINVGIGALRTGIFNVADMALIAGLILLAVFGYRSETADSTPQGQPYDDNNRPL